MKIKKLLLALIPVIAVAIFLDRSMLGRLPDAVYAAQPKSPELAGGKASWLNTPGDSAFRLYGDKGILANDPLEAGKHSVVLVDFWEYTCVNCINTFPYIKEWSRRYQPYGLVVVGIHTPEFKFGHDPANVAKAVKHLGITYPVLIDSDFNNWNAFNNESWPADYLIDSHGRIVSSHMGEGDYAETEQEIRSQLLKANPGEKLPPAYGDPASNSVMSFDMTPELYGGSSRGQIQNYEGFGNGETINYKPVSSDQWQDGQLELSGTWNFNDEYAQHVGISPSDSIGVKYHANTCVAVIKLSTDMSIKVRVTLDGQPVPKSEAGIDIHYDSDGSSYLLVDAPREYQITRNTSGGHNISLYPGSDQFRLYSFCFTNV